MFDPKVGTKQNAYTRLKMATSTTVTVGQALAFTSGLVRPATSADAEIRYVSADNKTSTSDTPYIKVIDVRNVKFEADTTGNTSQGIVGTKIDLTDSDTINQSATSTKVFFVEDYVGVVSNKKVLGYFVKKDA